MFHVIPLVFGLALSSASASVTDDLDRADRSAEELVGLAEELDHRIAPGRAYLNQTDALMRFEDHLFALMVGNYREAAEGFFGLVTTGALREASLHRDAEWYLAEALFGMGNVVTAESRFRLIAEDAGHPFREDAVRKLLELYASTDQDERFTTLYEAEIVRGRVKASGAVTYTIGKSFYKRGDFEKSRGFFGSLPPSEPFYGRAQYFLGVIELRDNNLDASIPFFVAASNAPVIDVASRKTQDLALLALARLAYERSAFSEAATYYQQIGGDSVYLADVLREQVWSFIKENRYDEALRAVDLFLLAYPEHKYSGSLRVVEGHLFMGCGQMPERCPNPDMGSQEGDAYERALAVYEDIVKDYSPIRDRFQSLADSQDEPATYFQNVLAAGGADATGLPPFAISMMRHDAELGAALTLYERLEEQRADLSASEQLVAELEALLSGPTSVGGYDSSRYQAVVNQARAIREQVELLDLEQGWLAEQNVTGLERFNSEMASIQELSKDAEEQIKSQRSTLRGIDDASGRVRTQITEVEALIDEARTELGTVRKRLAAPNRLDDASRRDVEREASEVEEVLDASTVHLNELRVELSQIHMPSIDESLATKTSEPNADLARAIDSLRESFREIRPGREAAVAQRFDALHQRLQHAAELYARVLDRIESLADSEIARVRERFDAEVLAVRAQRIDLDTTSAETEHLAVDLTRKGFGRMEDFFADGVLKAEMGIIDVYWARKLEIADRRQRIQDERNSLVAELERRFAIIRQKMEQ